MAKKTLLLFSICLLGLARPVHADTIGPVRGSCFGSSYTLSYSSTGNPDAFNVFLTIDATGYTGANTNLNAVKALYATQAGQQDGITSEGITLTPGVPMPEPSPFLLIGIGLLWAADSSAPGGLVI